MIIAGKEVKVIKEYDNFILIQYPAGYRECISRFDLGQVQEVERRQEPRLRGVTGLRV